MRLPMLLLLMAIGTSSAVGCGKRDIYAPERAYVQAHPCVATLHIPAGSDWSIAHSRVVSKPSFTEYKCEGLNNYVLVSDYPWDGN